MRGWTMYGQYEIGGQILRNLPTKHHQTRRECLAKASKPTVSHSQAAIHIPKSIICASNTPRENRLIHDFTICVISSSSSSVAKPAISMLERVDALIFSLKVSRVSGDVHGQQAIFSLLLLVCTVNLWELTG